MSDVLKRRLITLGLSFLPLYGVWMFGQGVWIHAKAQVAQVLLETAWSQTRQGHKEVKPWPWADTWPVGRLTVPRLGERRLVLAGASGSSLAFGPGHLFNSAAPGEAGNCVIAGHRDTHFRFIRRLKKGDHIVLENPRNEITTYEVQALLIVDENSHRVLQQDAGNRLTLITCYPFDAIRSGGPLRYVVIARAVSRSVII